MNTMKVDDKKLREKHPEQAAQYLTDKPTEENIAYLMEHHLDLDVEYHKVTPGLVANCHKNGIKVNCWTCDNKEYAEKLISYGVDFITSNILE